MIQKITKDAELKLYDYFIASRRDVPYYFPVSFEHWRDSMFNDCDYDGRPLFSELETYLLANGSEIKGFIQFGLYSRTKTSSKKLFMFSFGSNHQPERKVNFFSFHSITNFVFSANKKDYTKQYGIIRNIHYAENAENIYMLFDKAAEYFDRLGIDKRYAYFHYFGMSCYARQGKLHSHEFYIDDRYSHQGLGTK